MPHPIKDRIDAMFSDLTFDDRRHLYYLDGKRIPSVSSKVETHAPKFNREKMLPLSAKKHKVSVEELGRQWDNKRDTRAEIGTRTHDFLEKFSGVQKPHLKEQEAGIKFFLGDVKDKYTIIAREKRCYSRKFWYAGTWDLLLEEKYTGNIILADYKTNLDLFKSYDYLHPPFDQMRSDPFNKYQLQLSYYQIMLEEIGIYIHDRIIVYLSVDEKGKSDYQILPTGDFTTDLRTHMIKNKKCLELQ